MIFRLFKLTFIFYFLMVFSSQAYSQIDWHLNSEVGLFKSSGDGILKKGDLLTRFDGSLGYEYDTDIRNVSVSLRVRPEFYSFKSPVNSIKIKAEGNYFQAEENFNWGFNLTRQINFFNNDVADFTYDIFKSPVNSIKIKAEGNYFQAEENFNWGFNLTRQINFFNNDVADFTYDIF